MRRQYFLLACVALPCALVIGCTTSDREYVRNHIALLQKPEARTHQADYPPPTRLEPGEAFGLRQSSAAF